MRTILKTLESPDKRYQLILQKRTSLMNTVDGNDDFYLLITDRFLPPVIKTLLRRNVKIGQSYYEPAAQAFLNPYGDVIRDIQINPQKKHIDVTLSGILFGKGSECRYKKIKKIPY